MRADPNFIRGGVPCEGEFEIPIIRKEDLPCGTIDLIACSRTRPNDSESNRQKGVHFFVDDYRFASLRKDYRRNLETTSASETILKQMSLDGKESADVVSELTQRINQRFRGATPPVVPLFEDTCIYREHPLFPGSQMAVYACELSGEFSEYVHD